MPKDTALQSYPRPPFPRQEQAYPGLAQQMLPVPDHGEKSYVGHGRLAGKKALVEDRIIVHVPKADHLSTHFDVG